MQDTVHTTYNFVLTYEPQHAKTHMQPDFASINASQALFYELELHCFASKLQEGIQNDKIQCMREL